MRLLFVFVDGIGLGSEQPGNPFVDNETPGISYLLNGNYLTIESAGYTGAMASLLGLDAVMGVDGLPQSATGQASIFTGYNAPGYLGYHLNGFPDENLRQLLASSGIFLQLKQKGYQVNFANAYRPAFFKMLKQGLPGNHYSCSTLITYYGGLPFNGLHELKEAHALYMDITNATLIRKGFNVPLITPDQGASRLLEISANYDFCLFEYFLSDLAGHMADRNEAARVLSDLDCFISALSVGINPSKTVLMIASDHGNMEYISSREHTANPVPLLIVGDGRIREAIVPIINDLKDILTGINVVLES
ncbi:MAG: hypothetical protein ACQES4_00215 [Bacillota bacterium]